MQEPSSQPPLPVDDLHGMAHELNNLLAAIMNYAALVQIGLTEQATRLGLATDAQFGVLTSDISEIRRATSRAAELVRQLPARTSQLEIQDPAES